jgi:hypothetical protein
MGKCELWMASGQKCGLWMTSCQKRGRSLIIHLRNNLNVPGGYPILRLLNSAMQIIAISDEDQNKVQSYNCDDLLSKSSLCLMLQRHRSKDILCTALAL